MLALASENHYMDLSNDSHICLKLSLADTVFSHFSIVFIYRHFQNTWRHADAPRHWSRDHIGSSGQKERNLYAKSKLTPAQLHMQRGICQRQGAGPKHDSLWLRIGASNLGFSRYSNEWCCRVYMGLLSYAIFISLFGCIAYHTHNTLFMMILHVDW